jgi:hypothetical protein
LLWEQAKVGDGRGVRFLSLRPLIQINGTRAARFFAR